MALAADNADFSD